MEEPANDGIQAPKPKRTLSEQQKANLAKGRELGKLKLKEKSDRIKDEKLKAEEELKKLEISNMKLKDKAVIKKANNLIKEKLKIKKTLDLQDYEDDSEEEIIIPIQPKKPKKKQIVYLPPESDSEEEVIYKRAPKQNKKVEPVAPARVGPNKIIFW